MALKKQLNYGKKSLKQRLLVYAVVALVVYGVIYYLFWHEGLGSGGDYGY